MLNKNATVKQVCTYFNEKKRNLPVIVDVQNSIDYCAIFDGITEKFNVLRVSSYFGESPFPDTNKMRLDILSATSGTVVLGLFHFFAFHGGITEILNTLAEIINNDCKILILTFGIKDIIEKKVLTDVRLQERAQIFFINGHENVSPKMSLTTFDLKNENSYESLKKYFRHLEDNGCGYGVIKSSFITAKMFHDGIWSVAKHNSAYELLIEMDETFTGLDESFGTDKHWEELLKDIEGKTFKELLFTHGPDLISVIKKFKAFNDSQKWRIFLWLKTENRKDYLSVVAKKVNNTNEIIPEIYNTILDIEPQDIHFDEYYCLRKELISAIDNAAAIKEFVRLSDSKQKNKVFYLTDITEIERKEIIKCFTKYDYSSNEMKEITETCYPLLGAYLSTFVFDNEILDGYFEDYKIQKIKNRLDSKFMQVVDANAIKRPFNCLPARSKLLSQLNVDNSSVYWVDALGAEFCGFINQRCKHYGLSVKIIMARAELPTLTKFNNDFSPLTIGKSIKELDKLKHEGVGDYDYSKTNLPLYIESELRIIDDILYKAQAELSDKEKIIIVSDHGASRLVRLANNILTIEVDAKEKENDERHGGRCCAWDSNIPKQFNTVTDIDNNGYCVIANYDRFKGGKYTGVELHGGATLEEVVVPIIEITNKTTEYKYKLVSPKLKLRGRTAEPLMISLSREVEKPRIKIRDQNSFISPIVKSESTYTFITGIIKSGNYKCSFFNDNEEIIPEISFEVESALGSINDLL